MLFHGSEWHTLSPVLGINFFPAVLISLKGSFFSYCEMHFYLRNVNVSCELILERKPGDTEKTLNSSDYAWKKFDLSKLYRIVENTIFYFFPQEESFLFLVHMFQFIQFSSVAQSCWTLCDPMDCSTPDLPPCPSPTPEFTQTQVHTVSGALQPSHPLSSPSPPALNLSQQQGLFK